MAIPSPARSIKVRLGTPYFWIVKPIHLAHLRSGNNKHTFKRSNRSTAPLRSNGLNVLNHLNDLNRLFSRFGEQLLHLAHSLFDPDDNRAGDNTVADVEFDDFRNGGDG